MVDASTVQISVLRGRDGECRLVRDLLDRTVHDDGAALLFQGEPGSGRTALLTFAHRHAQNFTVLAGTGLIAEATLPYAGLQRLLDPVLNQARALPGRQLHVLRRALAGEDCPGDQRLTLSMAVLGLLTEVGRKRPLLCTVDDIDSVDPSTVDVLAFAARRLRRRAVAVIFTGAVDTVIGGVSSARLTALDADSSAAILADRLPGGLPDAVVAPLSAIARGNPQALVDLAGGLTPGQLRGDDPLPSAVPVNGALGRGYHARLSRLPADTRRLLLLAALDKALDAATLTRAAQVIGMDIAALAPAERAGLVRVEPHRVRFPHPVVRTVLSGQAPLADRRAGHLLLARLLNEPGDRLRRAVHLGTAACGPDPALAAELEEAAGQAGAVTGAGGYATASAALERAAQLTGEPVGAAHRMVTAARYAWLAGRPRRARWLLRALTGAVGPVGLDVIGRAELLRGEMELRSGAAHVASGALLAAADVLADTHRELAIDALVWAGEAVCFSGDHYRYAEIARRAASLRRPVESPAMELMFAHLAGFAATFRGDHERARPALRRVVTLADRLIGPALPRTAPGPAALSPAALSPAALTWAAGAGLLLAADETAYRFAERAVEFARARGDRSVLPRALELRACAEYWLDRHEAALNSSREGLLAARAGGQIASAASHLGMLAVLAAIRGDRDATLRRIREIGEAPGEDSRPRALGRWALAVLDLSGGRRADAATRLADLGHHGTGRGHLVVKVMATPYLVEAAAHAPDRSAAAAALAVFDRWASGTASRSHRAISARCHALLAPRGSVDAENAFRKALRLHPAGGWAFERARTQLLFGRELRRSRRPSAAREHLHSALETFVYLAAPPWIDQTIAELRAAGEAVDAPGQPATRALTAQQSRIARLVAEGATNREIAARMFLSTRTVDHHMRNIFSRLGVRSRTELARTLS